MFDTKETGYKITSPKTPFSSNPKRNITKEIFDAFRKEGFMTGRIFQNQTGIARTTGGPIFRQKTGT
jgi:alpha-L-fucosidase